MKVLVPLAMTDAMLSSSTIAEPDSGEASWDAGASYNVGDRVIRTQTHRVYENLIAGVNATTPEVAALSITPRWFDYGPTIRWAAFDTTVNTASQATTSLSFVLLPGFINAIAMYGLTGANVAVSLKDAPGGSVVYAYSSDLLEPPLDYYDYYFGPFRALTKLVVRDLVPYANPELTITITAAGGSPVGVGMIAIGDLRQLIVSTDVGGTLAGATAEPVTYSYIKTDAYGRTEIRRRHHATDMRVSVWLPRFDADAALATVQEVLDIPAAWIATDVAGYSGLNAFGLGSGVMTYEGDHAVFNINVKGFI